MSVMVIGTGACTAVGGSAASTAAAVRAGIAGFIQHPFVVDVAGNPPVVAPVQALGFDCTGAERLAALAFCAAMEAIDGAALAGGRQAPLFLGLPAQRPGDRWQASDLAGRLAAELEENGRKLARVEVFRCGHAAGMVALESAWQAIERGETDTAVVGGVDSYLNAETLEWLEADDRLHSAGFHNNPYGFVPGEGAGFAVLAGAVPGGQRARAHALQLVAVHRAHEPVAVGSDDACVGTGLTGLFRALQASSQGAAVDGLYCDLNGEPERSDEFGFASIRSGALMRDPSAFVAPADCWGDVGAASGPLYLVLAREAMLKGYAPGPWIAAYTSAQTGERGGFVARRAHSC